MRTFFKNRPPWFYIVDGIAVELEPRRPIFEKNILIFEKKGGADFFPGFVLWVVWAESPTQI
jgi:hypothetical protein